MGGLKQQLISGVVYTSIAKYAGFVISLVVSGVLARLLTPDDFGVVAVAMVIIAFFGILSDLGLAPAIIQNRDLTSADIDNIFSFTVWTGVVAAALFFGASWGIASYYNSPILVAVCQILSVNLLFATANIVPNALLFKAKRFRFIAFRTLFVQVVVGVVAIIAALYGAGIYALLINPIVSGVALFAINWRENPVRLRLRPDLSSVRKVFSFSAYQFCFNVLNYFSRNLDKLFVGKYMGMSQLGYYEKSYRLMMMPLQNITYVISPVMHPIFAEFQNDLRYLAESYLKVIRFLGFIGLPLAAVLFFTARELVLLIFGGQWEPSVRVFEILSLSVAVQIVMSTSGPIFQAANATRQMFWCGVFSAVTNVAGLCVGIFVFGNLEAVAWCIVVTFAVNFVQCFFTMYYQTFHISWRPFWQAFISPMAVTVCVVAVLWLSQYMLTEVGLIISLCVKCAAAGAVWLSYIQLCGEYDILSRIKAKLKR